MKSKASRLDRFISQRSDYTLADTRLLIAQKRILVDGHTPASASQPVRQFTHVLLDGECLQDCQPIHLMFHKPKGCVSATKDLKNPTVIDLLAHPQKHELHIAGRLDFNTTGLMLLTNDGAWSRKITLPETKLPKTYEVTLSKPLDETYIAAFEQGIYFAYENLTTQPAQLEIVSDYTARLSIVEGKYHQVKRMFGYFENEVLSLHRVSVGHIVLGDLEVGQSRALRAEELALMNHP